MILVLMLELLSVQLISGNDCNSLCSNIFDYVCGAAKTSEGNTVIMRYQNICYLNKIRCQLKEIVDLFQIPNKMCGLEGSKSKIGRRNNDFSIVGAHQECNHTCPTYCVDTYEPLCAQIHKRHSPRITMRPMINHCHIDLFSCAMGVNVTIKPISLCYKNPSDLMFMSQIAAMKSLRLLDSARRSYDGSRWQKDYILNKLSYEE